MWRKAAINAPDDITDDEHDRLRKNYRKEVKYLDRKIGNLLTELERLGVRDETTIILTSDHGDEFYEHGRYGHKNLPYDELTHVPLMIRFPESSTIDQPHIVDTPVRAIDSLPTVLDSVGADVTNDMSERMEGESLLPVLQNGDPSYDVLVTEKEMRTESDLRLGFRTSRWKFLYDGADESTALYDLNTDPEETTDVSSEHESVVKEFQDVLADRFASIESTSSDISVPELSEPPGVEEQLKALGYK